jgi:hypothetical protein
MNKLLDKAFKEAARLPESEQEALAQWLLAELQAERRWEEAFARSESDLSGLAEEALAEHRRGEAEDLDPDQL